MKPNEADFALAREIVCQLLRVTDPHSVGGHVVEAWARRVAKHRQAGVDSAIGDVARKAAAICRQLFTTIWDGKPQIASRLELKYKQADGTEKPFGGWCAESVFDVVFDVLSKPAEQKSPQRRKPAKRGS